MSFLILFDSKTIKTGIHCTLRKFNKKHTNICIKTYMFMKEREGGFSGERTRMNTVAFRGIEPLIPFKERPLYHISIMSLYINM